MKRKHPLLASAILAVCVIVLAVVLWFTKGTFTMSTETLHIGAVLLDSAEVTADQSAVIDELDGLKWTNLLGEIDSAPISDGTIEIIAVHDNAPAHFVLNPDQAIFYRDAGPFSYYATADPEQLYQSILSLISVP